MINKKNQKLIRLVISAVLLAIGLVLPFLTGQIPAIGTAISPLHIPALICGLTCGPVYGALMGAVLPLLRSALFGMPPFPNGSLPMAFELCAYGLFCGLLYPALTKVIKTKNHLPAILCALIISMILGRCVGGAAKALLLTVGLIGAKAPFTFAAFFTSYFAETAIGAVIHIVLVPAVVVALEAAKLSPNVLYFAGEKK